MASRVGIRAAIRPSSRVYGAVVGTHDGGFRRAVWEAGALVAVAAVAVAAATATEHTGPILAFTAALLVASITAVTTNRRQRTQLQEDVLPQQQELTAAASRFERQLQHERQLRDLDHLRAFMDAAADCYQQLVVIVARARRRQLDDTVDAAVVQLMGFESRLMLRFGSDEPVAIAFHSATNNLRQAVAVARAPSRPFAEDAAEEFEQLLSAAGTAYGDFLGHAVALVGAAPSPSVGDSAVGRGSTRNARPAPRGACSPGAAGSDPTTISCSISFCRRDVALRLT